MTDVIVKDNYLPEADFLTIYNKLCNIDQKDPQRLPWFPGNPLKPLQPKVNILCQPNENIQFTHQFIPQRDSNEPFSHIYQKISVFLPLMDPLVEAMKIKSCTRIKANLTMRTHEIVRHGFHSDDNDAVSFQDYKVSIFYVNSNDGYTEFENGSKVKSVANRLITFPAFLRHTGTTCTDEPFRVVINFNYF